MSSDAQRVVDGGRRRGVMSERRRISLCTRRITLVLWHAPAPVHVSGGLPAGDLQDQRIGAAATVSHESVQGHHATEGELTVGWLAPPRRIALGGRGRVHVHGVPSTVLTLQSRAGVRALEMPRYTLSIPSRGFMIPAACTRISAYPCLRTLLFRGVEELLAKPSPKRLLVRERS